MRPRRRARRAVRRAVLRPHRRVIRRHRRRMRRFTRRILLGTAVLLAIGGSTTVVKINGSDVETIEREVGNSTDDLTEKELKSAMKKLGIKELKLTPEDEDAIAAADEEDEKQQTEMSTPKASFCPNCGDPLGTDQKFCEKCGYKIS